MSSHLIEDQIRTAIGAHGAWKLHLRAAVISGTCDTTGDEAACDDRCAFGKWLHGQQIDNQTRRSVPFRVVLRLHKQFHACAGDVIDAALAGQKDEALSILEGDFTDVSHRLRRAMVKWAGEQTRQRCA